MTPDPMSALDHPVDWPVPPPNGYFADDLDRMIDLPPHTELIDGSLVFVSPQAMFHMLVIRFLERELDRQAPADLLLSREMTVTLGRRQRLEPDILVAKASAFTGLRQTTFFPDDVVLVVEVVSPDSVTRDRERKPQLYAQAGIAHMWRVECSDDDRVVVYVYELDVATSAYSIAGIYHERLKLGVPFDIDMDLSAATYPRSK